MPFHAITTRDPATLPAQGGLLPEAGRTWPAAALYRWPGSSRAGGFSAGRTPRQMPRDKINISYAEYRREYSLRLTRDMILYIDTA